MNELLDPDATYIITMVMMLSLNLMFNEETFSCFKTFFIRRTRASVSAIMCELGNKSKNYHRMRDMSFWKLHDKLKDKLNTRPARKSRRCRKKRKKMPSVPNGLTCSSLRLSIALRLFAGGAL